jgi:hypothetical protein
MLRLETVIIAVFALVLGEILASDDNTLLKACQFQPEEEILAMIGSDASSVNLASPLARASDHFHQDFPTEL